MSAKDSLKRLGLQLGVARKPWQDETDPGWASWSGEDEDFMRLREQVLARDEYTCRFCSFRAEKWQEITHLDDDHTNHSLDNLATACRLCHLCQHLLFAGSGHGGHLVWCPHLSQADINRIARLHYAIKSGRGCFSPNPHDQARLDMVDKIFQAIDGRGRKQIIDLYKTLVPDAPPDNIFMPPEFLAQWLRALPDKAYHKRHRLAAFSGIRLIIHRQRLVVMPRRNERVHLQEYWADQYQSLPPRVWDKLLA